MLRDIPMDVWNYKLCNRYALDGTRPAQGREIPAILEKFDINRFTDYKEKVIDLPALMNTLPAQGNCLAAVHDSRESGERLCDLTVNARRVVFDMEFPGRAGV